MNDKGDETERNKEEQKPLINIQNTERLSKLFESASKITLATFGGALVGHALDQRQRLSQRTGPSTPSLKRTGPPRKSGSGARIIPSHIAAKSWALSCMFFATILETSRHSSPTSFLWKLLPQGDTEQTSLLKEDSSWIPRAFITVGDYVIGGSVAGLAGAYSSRPQPTSVHPQQSTQKLRLPQSILQSGRRPLILFGVGMGAALGFLAGSIEALNIYLEETAASNLPGKKTDSSSN